MTLVARNKPPTHHKKYVGKHHRISKTYHKAYLPYLPLLAVVAVGVLLNSALPGIKHGVLGYATDMSISSLLSDTNAQRGANGESALALNSLLDNAAQSKANDMAARDYWSHNTPDGQAPWSFMTAAGYHYQLAGENLAYGFNTADETLTGWMNSPGHRANILNSGYVEVGFGIANVANYQGSGPETIVVAMYGSPANGVVEGSASAPTPPTASNSTPAVKSGGASVPAPTVPVQTAPTPTAAVPAPAASANSDTATPVAKPAQKVVEPAPQEISRMQLLTAGKAPWSAFVLSLLGSVGVLFFLLRHGFAWHKVWVKGERFVINHVALDMLLVGLATLAFVFTRSSGLIR